LVTGLPSWCEAARISRYLTAEDRSRPMVLDQAGLQIPLRDVTHPDQVRPGGMIPTYLAFPLHGGEHFPKGTPMLSTGSSAGETPAGRLDLAALVHSRLNTVLEESGMVVVDTPHRAYLVEFLPRIARFQAASRAATSPSSGTGGTTAQATPTPNPGANQTTSPTSQAVQSIDGIPTSELSQWFKLGSNQFIKWTSTGYATVEKALDLGNPKATATKPSLNLAAQVLAPPLAEESSPSSIPLPAPIPEPSTWIGFGLVLGATGLRQGLRRWAGRAA
jgi:hypothetical protein